MAPPPDARRVRSFVAIEVEEPARTAVIGYLAALRTRVADVAWTPPENLHVTLKFLGDVAPDRLTMLARRLVAIAAAATPFSVAYAGVGAFPTVARPRVLWVGAAAPALAPLAALVDAAATDAGVAPADHPLHPHVTLGRLRDRRGSRAAGRATAARDVLAADRGRNFGAAPARAMVLFRSDTGPSGARHTPLARAAFGG